MDKSEADVLQLSSSDGVELNGELDEDDDDAEVSVARSKSALQDNSCNIFRNEQISSQVGSGDVSASNAARSDVSSGGQNSACRYKEE
jgi:hypothetical protein